MTNDPFHEGHRAYYEDFHLWDNPYDEGTPDFHAWNAGFLTAEVEDEVIYRAA